MLMQYFIVIIVILLILNRWKPNKLVKFHQHQQLGNDWKYVPIIGNAVNFIGSNEDRMTGLIQITLQSFKRKHNAVSMWVGPIFFVVLSDAEQTTVVLKSTLHKNFLYKYAENVIGKGSVFAPVDIWRRRRKIIAPIFAPRFVTKFVPVFETQHKTLVEKLKSKVGKGNFSCWDYIASYSLDSVCETVFGLNLELQRQPDHPFIKAFIKVFENTAARIFQPWLQIDAIYKLMPVYARQQHMKKIMHEFIDDLICKMKALVQEEAEHEVNTDNPVHSTNTKRNFKTFLELIIESSKNTDKTYTLEELREETLVLLLAGTDTTAVGISTTILLLSQHTDVQERVYKEIQEVIGDSDKPLQYKDLDELKYTKAVINETLRLYPPVPFIIRYCEDDVKLPTGIILPEGSNVIVSIWGIHRNPEHWGDDANDFNPDRFMSGKIPNAFMPFSNGPRNCVGPKYAMLSITTTLVEILRQYRFTPATNFTYDKNTPLRLSFEIMMKHVDGFTVQVEDRNKIAK